MTTPPTPPTPTPPAAPPAPEPAAGDPTPAAGSPDDADDGSGSGGQNPDDDTDDAKLSNEAKRYRLKLRETEAERAALKTQLNAVRDGIVAEVAGAHLGDPRYLYVDHSSDEFVREDGSVDKAKVEAACVEAAKRLGITRGRPLPNPQQGNGSSGGANVKPSWAQALQDGRNQ